MRPPRAQPLPATSAETGWHVLIADQHLCGPECIHCRECLVIPLRSSPAANPKHAAGHPPGEPHPVADLADLGRTAWADCVPTLDAREGPA